MSQETEYFDPRAEVPHPIDKGHTYNDSRTDNNLVLVFENDDVVLMRDQQSGGYRLENRDQFESNVGSERYSLVGEAGDVMGGCASKIASLIDKYDGEGGRKADHFVTALEEALMLVQNGGRPDDNDTVDFESISGIGSKTAQNLRSAGFTVKGDVRDADDEELLSIGGMGEKNLSNLREVVA